MVGQCYKSFQQIISRGFADTSRFNKDFIKSSNEEIDEEHFLEVDVQYLGNLHNLHNDLLFLPDRMKIEKVGKLVANSYDKTEYIINIRNLKQALHHGLVLKKFHRVTKLNQNAWLKPYINMNTDLRKKAKNGLEKDFFKLMNNEVFEKTMENVRKNRNITLVRIEKGRNYLVSEPNNHTTKIFT